METRSWMMLRVLINHFNPKVGNILIRFLPQSDAQQVMNQDIQATDIMPMLYQPQRLVEKIHYSWIQPLLEKFPPRLHPLVVASLTPEQSSALQTSKISKPVAISIPVKTFFLNQLYSLLQGKNHLPIEYLPNTELFPLVNWNKKRLVHLIDFLSLHDLAYEIRRIVDRNQLKNLYNCLSPKELSYLKICLHQKEKLIPPKLDINPMKKDCEKLKQVLHRRGLIRLAKALGKEHPDLMWYIAHTLDSGRGKILLKYYQEPSLPEVTRALKQQVINLMNFLKKE